VCSPARLILGAPPMLSAGEVGTAAEAHHIGIVGGAKGIRLWHHLAKSPQPG
jgi:hypothetical protein